MLGPSVKLNLLGLISLKPGSGGQELAFDESFFPIEFPVDVPVNYQLQVIGGTPPYTFTITKNNLPTGLSSNSAGLITGTPTVVESTLPTYLVEDSVGASLISTLSVAVI